MTATCKRPDRDVPKLVCGYPLPCPHHTVVLEDDDGLTTALANLRWLGGRTHITTYATVTPCRLKPGEDRPIGGRVITVRTKCISSPARAGINTKDFTRTLPLTASIVEIRNAIEETQIEGRAWIEERYSTPAFPVTADDIENAAAEICSSDEALRALELAERLLGGYLPGCRRPQHRDGMACVGGCDEVPNPRELREVVGGPSNAVVLRVPGRELDDDDRAAYSAALESGRPPHGTHSTRNPRVRKPRRR